MLSLARQSPLEIEFLEMNQTDRQTDRDRDRDRVFNEVRSFAVQISVDIGQDKLEDKLAHGSVGPLRRSELAWVSLQCIEKWCWPLDCVHRRCYPPLLCPCLPEHYSRYTQTNFACWGSRKKKEWIIWRIDR